MKKLSELHVNKSRPSTNNNNNVEVQVEEGAERKLFCINSSSATGRQYFAAFIANIGAFTTGNAWSWSATAFPSLEEDTESDFHLSSIQYDWLASVIFLGAMLVCPFAGFFVNRQGLRGSMLISVFPLIFGWILIALAQNYFMLLGGRFFTGFFAGGVCFAAPAFVAEVTSCKIRGKLSFAYYFMFALGVLYIFVVGAFVSWRWQAIACGIIPLVFFCLMLFIPESPQSLLAKGDQIGAIKSWVWYHGANNSDKQAKTVAAIPVDLLISLPEHNEELLKLNLTNIDLKMPEKKQQQLKSKIPSTNTTNNNGLKFWKVALQHKATWIAIWLQFFLQTCGEIPILAFTIDIFKSAGIDESQSHLCAIAVGATQVISVGIGSLFVDKIGRKILLILSELFMASQLIILGIYVYYKEISDSSSSSSSASPAAVFNALDNTNSTTDHILWNIDSSFNWIPLTCLIIFIVAFAFGIGPLPWVAIGELLGGMDSELKAVSTILATISNRIFGFLCLIFFNDLIWLLGKSGCYYTFAVSCFAGAIYIFIFVPETKGKTLEEIQIMLNNK